MLKKASIFRSRYTTGYGVLVLISGMLVLSAIGMGLIWQFYKSEHRRALLEWQVVLSLVAESREKDVDAWLEEKFQTLAELADNVSLKAYMTDLANSAAPAENNGEAPQPVTAPDYLRILLHVTSEKSGFKPAEESENDDNEFALNKTAGIALLNSKREVISATRYMPEISGKLVDFVNSARPGEKAFLDIFSLDNENSFAAKKTKMIAFLQPVFSAQGERKPENQIGFVIGVLPINESLFSKLYQPGIPYADSETMLVRRVGNFIEYISPLIGPAAGQTLILDANTDNLDAAFLIASGGGFAEKTDYRRKDVLAVARKIENAPWYLIHKIDAETALKSFHERTRHMAIILVLISLLALITLFAIWRHASSLRAESAAKEYHEMSDRHAAQEKLLKLIADSQPDAVSILDDEGNYRFANLIAAMNAKMKPLEMFGKNIKSVLGANSSKKYLEGSRLALEKKSIISYLKREKLGKVTKVFQVKHIPLKEIPDPYNAQIRAGTLIVEQDISTAILERMRHEKTLRTLIETLTTVVDMRVPFFANHSARVSRLAKIIAEEMHLDRQIRETVEVAGKLINLGKVFTPEALLAKDGALAPEEMRKIQENAALSADLIKNIQFDGPVTETIRQSQEKLDGSGIFGLKAEEIILPARILGVANAFVSMISPRPYRPSLEVEKALEILLAESGSKYDRPVVVALIHYLNDSANDNSWLF